MSEYVAVQKSALKLKGAGDISAGKKKKKKNKESKHRLEQVVTSQNEEEEVKTKKAYLDKRTPAQIAFDKMQEKRKETQIPLGWGRIRKSDQLKNLAKSNLSYLLWRHLLNKEQMERILNKASKTHKHRVEDFNRHLDTLTEHYDIPKVSWTK